MTKIIKQPCEACFVKSLPVVAATLFAALLALSAVPAAFANDMTGVLVPQTDKAESHFIGDKNITLRYPAGSAIAEELNGEKRVIRFTLEGNDTASAISAFNNAFLEQQSPVLVTEMRLIYTAQIRGYEDDALISFHIEAIPKMENLVWKSSEQGIVVDLAWRNVHVTEPIVVNAPDIDELEGIDELEINIPMRTLETLYPSVAEQLSGTEAQEILEESVLDFTKFEQSMNTWHFLFDPSGSLVESSSFFREESGAKVVSIYSLGESSFREGTFEAEEKEVTANVDGTQVLVHTQTPKPSGQIQIAGFSTITSVEGREFALVTQEAPPGTESATGGFPFTVLLVLGGMMGAVAIFVLFRARK